MCLDHGGDGTVSAAFGTQTEKCEVGPHGPQLTPVHEVVMPASGEEMQVDKLCDMTLVEWVGMASTWNSLMLGNIRSSPPHPSPWQDNWCLHAGG